MEEKQTDSISPGMDTYISSIQNVEVRQTILSSFSVIYLSCCWDQINHSRCIFLVCLYMFMYVYMHVVAAGQCQMAFNTAYFLRQTLSLKLEFNDWID